MRLLTNDVTCGITDEIINEITPDMTDSIDS